MRPLGLHRIVSHTESQSIALVRIDARPFERQVYLGAFAHWIAVDHSAGRVRISYGTEHNDIVMSFTLN